MPDLPGTRPSLSDRAIQMMYGSALRILTGGGHFATPHQTAEMNEAVEYLGLFRMEKSMKRGCLWRV